MIDFHRRVSGALFWVAVCFQGCASAQVQMVDVGLQAVPLSPGGNAILEFQLRNTGPDSAAIELSVSSTGLAGQYSLNAVGDCPLPAPFASLTLGAGEIRGCRYRLERAASTLGDARVVFGLLRNGNTVQSKQFRAGDLTRLEWQQQVERPGAPGVPGRVRVTLRNAGPTPVGSVVFSTCSYFLPQASVPRVVGGECSAGAASICFTGGIDAGFRMEGLDPGASRTCTLEWQPAPGGGAFSLALTDMRKPASQALLENTNAAADLIDLQLLQVAAVLQLPGPGWSGLLFLMAAIVLAARRYR